MKISIYELLGLIKAGTAPKKIKVTGNVYEFDEEYNFYTTEGTYSNYRTALGDKHGEINLMANAFNKNVEILDNDYIEKIKEHKKNLLNKLAKNYGLEVVDKLKDSDVKWIIV